MEDKLKKLEKNLQDAQDEYSKIEKSYEISSCIAKAAIELIQGQIDDLRREEFRELVKTGSYHSRKNALANEVVFMKILGNDGKKLLIDEITKRYDDFGRLSSYYIAREETKPFFSKYTYENDHWYEITKEEFEKEII